jgi:hypothetical protein
VAEDEGAGEAPAIEAEAEIAAESKPKKPAKKPEPAAPTADDSTPGQDDEADRPQ